MKTKNHKKGLTAKKKAYLRGKLLERRRELLHGLDRRFSQPGPSRGGVPPDEADWASAEEAWHTELGTASIASADLADIEHALRKLQEGTFGRCENCSRPIPENRLRAMPFARLCVECKSAEEQRQAGGGGRSGGWEGPLRPPRRSRS